jgi:hypothetical protein
MVLAETSSLRARRCCFLGPLRARAGSVVHHTPHCTGASIVRCAVQRQQRGAQERRRGGGTREKREVAKEIVRAAGGKAAGAWVMYGGRMSVPLIRVGPPGVYYTHSSNHARRPSSPPLKKLLYLELPRRIFLSTSGSRWRFQK